MAITRESLDRLLAGLYPDAAADRIFAQHGERHVDAPCPSDRQRLLHAFHAPSKTGFPEEPFATAWRAASGGCPDRGDSPETTRIARTQLDRVLSLLPRLTRRRRLVVLRYFGLFGRRPHTFAELADRMRISSARIGQLLRRALRDLRLWSARWAVRSPLARRDAGDAQLRGDDGLAAPATPAMVTRG